MEAASQSYYLVINGKPEGPFTLQELKERKLKPGDFVKTAEMDDYKEAHEIAELRALFGFKKQVFLQYFAGIDQRITASAIDLFLVSLACVVPLSVFFFLIDGKIARLISSFSLLLIIPLVNLIYHIVMESSAKQGTYGKQLARIRVCDMQGERLTISHATGRNLAKVFSVLTIFTGYLYSFFNKERQCLHDVIAGTLVIQDRLVV